MPLVRSSFFSRTHFNTPLAFSLLLHLLFSLLPCFSWSIISVHIISRPDDVSSTPTLGVLHVKSQRTPPAVVVVRERTSFSITIADRIVGLFVALSMLVMLYPARTFLFVTASEGTRFTNSCKHASFILEREN